MKFIDTHCHPQYIIDGTYGSEQFTKDCQDLDSFLMVSISPDDADCLKKLSKNAPNGYYSVGIHPCHVAEHNFDLIEQFYSSHNQDTKLAALGETGLDYYHSKEHLTLQHDSFHRHLELSERSGLATIVHTRSASSDTLAILSQHPKSSGVIHCFTESIDFAREVLDLGYYISFSGIITFKKAQELREVVKYCPSDRILSETDAPYLAPVPYRGKSNHPQWVSHVVAKIAELRNETVSDMASILAFNTYKLFDKMQSYKK